MDYLIIVASNNFYGVIWSKVGQYIKFLKKYFF